LKPLYEHKKAIEPLHLRQLLQDPQRNSFFTARFQDIVFDYSH
jgi:glucose-6-phosphate isomerase